MVRQTSGRGEYSGEFTAPFIVLDEACLDLGMNLNIVLDKDVWKAPWHGPLFNSPYRESILLLKMRLFCWRLNHRSVTSHSREHSSVSGIRPQSRICVLKGIQLAEDQLNVLSRSSRPLVDRACETCAVPCCYPKNKSYHRNLVLPVRSITVNRFLLLMSRSGLFE